MSSAYHGSCLCGEVEFKVDAKPVKVTACHCTNCKKYTGTVFTSNVMFPPGTLEVTKGNSLVSSFIDPVQDSGKPLLRVFCSRCGCPLYSQADDLERTFSVYYSALDDFPHIEANGTAENSIPLVEYYTKDRAWWLKPIEGAMQPRRKPGMDDEPDVHGSGGKGSGLYRNAIRSKL